MIDLTPDQVLHILDYNVKCLEKDMGKPIKEDTMAMLLYVRMQVAMEGLIEKDELINVSLEGKEKEGMSSASANVANLAIAQSVIANLVDIEENEN